MAIAVLNNFAFEAKSDFKDRLTLTDKETE